MPEPARMSVTEARAALPRILERVEAGEVVTLTRHGRPVAVVAHPDAVRPRRAAEALARAAEIGEALEAARNAPLPPRGTLSQERADELIAYVHEGRSRR